MRKDIKMTKEEYKAIIAGKEYDFLRSDKRLSDIMILGLGGSHAYGTNVEGSDLDVRGVAGNSKAEILTGKDFEQVCDSTTDTTIYSFKKIVALLSNCNPNTIELLGLKPEHYLHISKEGKLLLNHKDIFLSQRAAYSFGGYANQQLRRLENCAAHRVSDDRREEHLLKTLQRVQESFRAKGYEHSEDIKLYIDKSNKEDTNTEIFFDAPLSHCSLRDFNAMYGELSNVVREFGKLGMRNTKAMEHNKISKHAMHLVRLYYMCFDILEKGEINTYREKEHDLLMDIRNGKYVNADNQPLPEFFELVTDLEKRYDYAKKNTNLPENPDMDMINDFVCEVNERIVCKQKDRQKDIER